ncbi:MAG: hypothetical protein DYG94_11770 [Leptolyngbya sp. PLA3]|nr:MAG: hypothetical protein EDM82_13125 [Cyanobacteria bacterium CYA]MCE7969402.1 hypothetical protein [Leptolyngbya sp. PL-A3]
MPGPLYETGNPIGGDGASGQPRPMIRHTSGPPLGTPVGRPEDEHDAAAEPAPTGTGGGGSKIRTFAQGLGATNTDVCTREPNKTGTGAIHVKSFHCKLTGDSLSFLDQQINEWLDANPNYEVKLVTTTVGEWTGKLKEPNLIVTVWV